MNKLKEAALFFLKPGCIAFGFFTFLLTSAPAFAHGISAADQQRIIEGGYLQYIGLGATHMLTGYDHLLFLFGIIFFLTSLKDVVKYVTAFTLGHSIVLILATFYKIAINYYLIDAVIALSVCYKGFDNINGFKKYLNIKSPNLVVVVFLFGLIHGFGLSSRLQQLPLGNSGLLLRILSLNVGVEIGQITALAVMLGFLTQWRKTDSFQRFSVVSNNGLILIGMLLFIMQIHGFLHVRNADEFGLALDKHYHEHERLSADAHRLSRSASNIAESGDMRSKGGLGAPFFRAKLNDIQAIKKATMDVAIIAKRNEIIEGKYLDKSWIQAEDKNKKIYKSKNGLVVISIKNTEENRTLYVLLTHYGDYLAANFSGEFKGI